MRLELILVIFPTLCSMGERLALGEPGEKVNVERSMSLVLQQGVCKSGSKGLDTDRPKLFWVCYSGKHVWQCYCQHLTVDAKI